MRLTPHRLACTALVFAAACTHAETAYVSDQLVVTLRAGPSTSAGAVGNVRSNATLEVLDRDGRWAQVRTANGERGWVSSQYLRSRPTAKLKLDETEKALAAANQRIDELDDQLAKLTTQLSGANRARASAEARIEENADAVAALDAARTELDALTEENRALSTGSAKQWFLIGAGVLGGGIALGLLLPRLKRQRRWDW